MSIINVDGLDFDFPLGWFVSKYDEWAFYRNQFSRMWNGIKALDLLAVDDASLTTGWLIEVKDYRINPRTKPSDLADEVACKVFDTLAALSPARVNASDLVEADMAKRMVRVKRYRVVLHLEQPAKTSKLRPRAINPADIQLKLRQMLKPVDAHPFVAEKAKMGSLAWKVN